MLVFGLLAVTSATTGDVDNLNGHTEHTNCLRATRHADYSSVLLSIGSPKQELNLLWAPGELGELEIWSERLHKSASLTCENFASDLNIQHARNCSDVAQFYDGQLERLSTSYIRFTYKSDAVAAYEDPVATQLGFDGVLRVRPAAVHFLTTSHLCSAPIVDGEAGSGDSGSGEGVAGDDADALRFDYITDDAPQPKGHAVAQISTVQNLSATSSLLLTTACHDLYAPSQPVDIFPTAAGLEVSWLHLSSSFLRTQAPEELNARRDVVEIGAECASSLPELARAASSYSLDCGIVASSTECRATPSVPFRRLAAHRLRIAVGLDGVATMRTERATVLASIPSLLPHSEGVLRAIGRLAVLLFVAAVVFVRGSQNAASAHFSMLRTLDRLHCRGRFAHVSVMQRLFPSERGERLVDLSISLLALGSRVAVLSTSWHTLIADRVGVVVATELAGVTASALHIAVRYSQQFSAAVDSPLTLLAGPMSIVDVCAAVLVSFSDAPLLSDANSKFSAIGRLLISLLISIAALPRCHFGASACAGLASACRNGPERRDLRGFQLVLVVATACWIVEAAAIWVGLGVLFAVPAAYAATRSVLGVTWPFKYTTFLGLLCTGLPSTNKVLLKMWHRELALLKKKE